MILGRAGVGAFEDRLKRHVLIFIEGRARDCRIGLHD